MSAKSIEDVILGEASYKGSKADIRAGMRAIADVMMNRSKATGESLYNVTRIRSQFNAQSPARGSEKYRAIAREVIKEAQTQPSTVGDALYYATPAARNNLPKGLRNIKNVNGHVFAADDKGRGIITRNGAKRVDLDAVRAPKFTGTAGIDESLQPPPTPKANPDFRYAAIPKARPDEQPTMVADLAPRKVATTRIGPDPRDIAERSFAKSWDTPADLQSQFAKAREAMGLSSDKTQTPFITPSAPVMASSAPIASRQTQKPLSEAQSRINSVWAQVPDKKTPTVSQVGGAPAIRPGYNRDESRAKTTQSRIDRTFAQIPTQKPRTRTVKTIEYKPTRVQITPKGKAKSSGMTLDNVGEFAPGPTSMNVRQMNADAFGVKPTPAPMPRAKPQFKTVMKPVTTYAQVPVPTPKPAMQRPQAQPKQSIWGKMFSPAGMAGGMVGSMLGGPIGGLAGNLAGRGFANVARSNPTVGNRGTTNSFSTSGDSGGPYAGQSWRNTSTGGTRVFNPSTRQYEDIGGSNAGNRSSSQRTGSGGGGLFSSISSFFSR